MTTQNAKTAIIYARTSTLTQAENVPSVEDQITQCRVGAEAHGCCVVGVFADHGKSARAGAKRPEVERMLAQMPQYPGGIDYLIVLNFSRLFRNEIEFSALRRDLAKNGVAVVSVEGGFEEIPTAGHTDMSGLRDRILRVLDEDAFHHHSMLVRRALAEDARSGFWNGPAPYGYTSVEVLRRGKTVKRRLVISAHEADTVKMAFRLALRGAEGREPLGLKAIADWLNAKGRTNRSRRAFSPEQVSRMLRRETYTGTHWFGVADSTTGLKRPRQDWIAVPVPQIVARDEFDSVQAVTR